MIVDVHAHWLPKEHYVNMQKYVDYNERVEPMEFGPGTIGKRVVRGGIRILGVTERTCDMEAQIKDMKDAGIDKLVIHTDTWQTWISMDTCRFVNDELAREVERYPDRLIGLAHVPPIEEAVGELDRAIKDLGFKGVGLTTHYRGSYIDEELSKPFLKKVAELDVPIIIHPNATPVEYQTLTKTPMPLMRVIDGGIGTARVLFNVLKDFPTLKFVMPQCGGAFMMMARGGVPVERERLARLFIDTAPGNRSPAMVKACIDAYGSEQVMFGTDYPFNYNSLKVGVTTIKNLDIDENVKKRILGENAATLLKI